MSPHNLTEEFDEYVTSLKNLKTTLTNIQPTDEVSRNTLNGLLQEIDTLVNRLSTTGIVNSISLTEIIAITERTESVTGRAATYLNTYAHQSVTV